MSHPIRLFRVGLPVLAALVEVLDLSDTIYLANYLFSGGSPPSQGTGCFSGQSEECESNPGCQ